VAVCYTWEKLIVKFTGNDCWRRVCDHSTGCGWQLCLLVCCNLVLLQKLKTWAETFEVERCKFRAEVEAALGDVDRVLQELVRLPMSSAEAPDTFAATLYERVKLISECQKKQLDIANALETLRSSPSDLRSKVTFLCILSPCDSKRLL
jgi:hypothetical protein